MAQTNTAVQNRHLAAIHAAIAVADSNSKTAALIVAAAKLRLAKFFKLDYEVFEPLLPATAVQWASEVKLPGYQLTHWQYRFLIGEALSDRSH